MASLVARRTIRATPEQLFDAWTEAAQLEQWWGPSGIDRVEAQVDLRPGGAYRIVNRFADGRVIRIAGEFEVVERPHRLVYTWRVDGQTGEAERVTVGFRPAGDRTEVVVEHERIASEALRRGHREGWEQCLVGLGRYVANPAGR